MTLGQQKIKQNLIKLILNHPTFKINFKNFIEKQQNKKIVFYGAGILLEEFLNTFDVSQLNIIGIIDSNKEKYGKNINNIKIYPQEALAGLNANILVISIISKENVLFNDKFLTYIANSSLEICQSFFDIPESELIEIKQRN